MHRQGQRALLAAAGAHHGDAQPPHHDRRSLQHGRYTRFTLEHRRILSTMPAAPSPPTLTDAEYRAKTGAVLASIETSIDAWLQDDLIDIDAQRNGGLLELTFPNGSKLILNTQAPLQELWLAARSGGFHYRWIDGAWRDTRDGRELFDALSGCASEQAQRPLRFVPPA